MLNHLLKSSRKSFPKAPDGLLDAVWCGALIVVFFTLLFGHAATVFSHTFDRPTFVAAVSVPSQTAVSARPVLRAATDPS
jgi:hypothetical protein